MGSPLVTVAMPVYNSAATVEHAIRSIQYQSLKDWELIVIDDGSTDRTREILAGMQEDPRIRLIVEPSGNLGLSQRLNQCVGLARGQYIARMDADDVAYPQRLERQVRFLQEHSDIDLLGVGAVVFKGAGEVLGRYPTACTHEEICRRPWWGFPLAHPTWMGKRTWFLTHPYCEGYTRSEDQTLLLRSFSDSRFAALEEVLLGYRMEGVFAKKMGQGRLSYCRQLVRQVHDIPSAVTATRGMLIHGLAFGRDVLLETTGSLSQRSRQAFQPANGQVENQWREVWHRVTSEELVIGEIASTSRR